MRITVGQLKKYINRLVTEAGRNFRPQQGEFEFEIDDFEFDDNRAGPAGGMRVANVRGTFDVEPPDPSVGIYGGISGHYIEEVTELVEDNSEQGYHEKPLDPQVFEDSLSRYDALRLQGMIEQEAERVLDAAEESAAESYAEDYYDRSSKATSST